MAKTQHCTINNYKMRQDAVQKVLRDHFKDDEITVEVGKPPVIVSNNISCVYHNTDRGNLLR